MPIKTQTIKFISALLIISIILPAVLFSAPKKTSAQLIVADPANISVSTFNKVFSGITSGSTVIQTGQILKDALIELGKQLLKIAAKRLLAQMTQSTIDWINSGFHGSPLFLENPESFFRDIAKFQVRQLVDLIGYDTFRFPFGRETALQVIDSYKRQLADNAQYTLSKVINDPDLLVRYRNDFNVGGWNGFLINTQYPQNNYLGFNMIIQQNLASQLEGTLMTPAQKVKDTLQYGMGFLSPQECETNKNYNKDFNEFNKPGFKFTYDIPEPADDPDPQVYEDWANGYETAKARAEADFYDPNGTTFCPPRADGSSGLVNTTPGSVAANSIFNALDTPRESTTLAGALGNSVVDSVSAIFDALLNKLLSDGLNKLSTTVSPGSAPDNWSYYGNTLSGGGSVTTTNTGGFITTTTESTEPLTINPQNIMVDIRNSATSTTIATISGGVEPYSMLTAPNEGIAMATIASTGLIVTGITSGQTSVVVRDSSATTIIVPITVIGIEDLNIQKDVSMLISTPETPFIDVSISGGTIPYIIVEESDEEIAAVEIKESGPVTARVYHLEIIGKAIGQTGVIVKDSSTAIKIVQVNIKVLPDGTCEGATEAVDEFTTQEECLARGGTWQTGE